MAEVAGTADAARTGRRKHMDWSLRGHGPFRGLKGSFIPDRPDPRRGVMPMVKINQCRVRRVSEENGFGLINAAGKKGAVRMRRGAAAARISGGRAGTYG